MVNCNGLCIIGLGKWMFTVIVVLVLVLQWECGRTGSGADVLDDQRVAEGRQEVAAAGALPCSVGRTGQGDRSGFYGT